MTRKNTITFIVILIIFGFALWAILPIQGERFGRQGLRLGLDLVGGVHLVYQVDFPEDASGAEKARDMDRALTTIENRIDKYGVTEPIIQQLGDDRILVQLPGFTDIDAAKSLVEQTGFLEFRVVELNSEGQPVYLSDYLEDSRQQFFDRSETGDRIFVQRVADEKGEVKNKTVAFLVKKDEEGIQFVDVEGNPIDEETLQEYGNSLSWIAARGDDGTPLTGDLLADAYPTMDQSGIAPKPVVGIKWNSKGSIIFDEIAKRLYTPAEDYSPQYLLGIFLDNSLLSSPKINSPEFHGSGVISGTFTVDEVDELANLLKSGALPMPLKKPPLYQEKVSATLGADFIEMSWMAGLIGIILVMLFMIAYYRFSGFLASLALIFYGVLVLMIIKFWPTPQITLTLAGIGGFIVSIGMAVDANVLIFERMKEELRTGRTLGAAIEAGFNRAWKAIVDSNVTTIIACIILIIVGSNLVSGEPVKWFGVILLIGTLISMFTAIVVTRTLLRLFVGSPLAKRTTLFTVDWGKK
jgi:protein-export membrane protein SecD